ALRLGGDDALDAVGAFLHDATRPNRNVGVALRLQRFGIDTRIEARRLVIAVVEAPNLVGAVGLAEAGADAAVIDLVVQPLVVVDRGLHRADRFARGMLALHAGNRHE